MGETLPGLRDGNRDNASLDRFCVVFLITEHTATSTALSKVRQKIYAFTSTSDDDYTHRIVTDNTGLFVLPISCLFLITVTICQCK